MTNLSSYQKLKQERDRLKAEIARMRTVIARGTDEEKAGLQLFCNTLADAMDALWFGESPTRKEKSDSSGLFAQILNKS